MALSVFPRHHHALFGVLAGHSWHGFAWCGRDARRESLSLAVDVPVTLLECPPTPRHG